MPGLQQATILAVLVTGLCALSVDASESNLSFQAHEEDVDGMRAERSAGQLSSPASIQRAPQSPRPPTGRPTTPTPGPRPDGRQRPHQGPRPSNSQRSTPGPRPPPQPQQGQRLPPRQRFPAGKLLQRRPIADPRSNEQRQHQGEMSPHKKRSPTWVDLPSWRAMQVAANKNDS